MANYNPSEKHSEIELSTPRQQQIDEPKIPSATTDEAIRKLIIVFPRRNVSKTRQKHHKAKRKINRKQRGKLNTTRDTTILVAILIATVTYSAGINPPGGVYQDGPLIGTSVAARRTAFKVFSVCNNLALFSSLTVVFIMFITAPFENLQWKLAVPMSYLAVWLATGFVAAAYVAAVVVIMKPAPPRRGFDWTTVFLFFVSSCALGIVMLVVSLRFSLNLIEFSKKIIFAKVIEKIDKTDKVSETNSI